MTPHRRPGLRALLTAALLWLGAAPARADGGVGLVVTGDGTMQPQLVAQLETWLRANGHELVSAALPPDAVTALIDCFVIEDQACARKVVEGRAKSRSVVFAQVDVTSGKTLADRTVTLTAYWFDKGRDAVAERRSCARCTDAAMRSTADELMAALAGDATRGRVKLTSTPAGATVTIDGKAIGKTPLDHSLPPGAHRIVFELEDGTSETRSVDVKQGQTHGVSVAFGGGSRPLRKQLAYAGLLGGAALAIGGGILIAVDEDIPNDTTDPTYLDTGPDGEALTVTGAAAIGVGVYLLVTQPRRGAAPAVSVVPGGGVIGWAGRF